MPAVEGFGRSAVHAIVRAYDELPHAKVVQHLRENIPEVLRTPTLRSYVVFKYKPPAHPKAKRGKVPYYVPTHRPRSGQQGAPFDLERMATFEEAITLYADARRGLVYGGIGICALAHNPCCFLDLDNCFDPTTGELNELANELLGWGTYTEFSPSGRGLRLILEGNLGLDAKNNALGIEAFSHKGFVTLTGLTFGKRMPVRPLSEQQLQRLRHLLALPVAAAGAPAADGERELRNIPRPLDAHTLPDVRRALKATDPDLPYADWVLAGQALHSGDRRLSGVGFKLWVKWSARGEKFEHTSEEEMRAKWQGFGAGRGVTLSSLAYLAKKYPMAGVKQAAATAEAIEALTPFDEELLPAVDLFTDVANIPDRPLDPVCTGLFDHTGAYALVGRAKIGKSRILGLLTAAALTGGKVFDYAFVEKCKVLVLTLEERMQDLAERLRLYMVDPADYVGQLAIVDHADFEKQVKTYGERITYVAWLELALQQFRPRFVYLDPLVNMRMMWPTQPSANSKRVTEQDYQMAADLQALAQRYQCVFVFTVHGSKRKPVQGAFDPFESVGTTSWMGAGCVGMLVLMDPPNFNPLEDEDEGRMVFSVRSRFRRKGDEHLLLQTSRQGRINSLGPYRHVIITTRQQDMLEVVAHAMEAGEEWITGRQIAQEVGSSQRYVRLMLSRFMRDGGLYQEGQRRLESGHGRGYRLVPVG